MPKGLAGRIKQQTSFSQLFKTSKMDKSMTFLKSPGSLDTCHFSVCD
jgi:hypothetical protein